MDRVLQLEDWYRRVYIDGDVDAVGELFTKESRAAGLMADMQVGAEDIAAFAMALVHLVDTPRLHIVKAVEDGDWLAALIECEAVRPSDGKPLRVTGQLMARYEGDKIVEAYNSFEFIGFFAQLGLLPEDSVAIGMSGQKIG
ncbi:SnoaL-like domain-containing protein [Rhodovulum sp. ES.010]|uniref:nuclear transport factor 2 family protein n=1 Tax=Rhodovulum sp. ES.010 TaxID=1882821 RepID=UPI00092B5BD7|nr:nuclear transport factor 2 family protein [Rhodovulum sp. ES.010]SIO26428.1 SnoaL-like domain-containing protein [Rhodovulum sp. ES.010]